MFGLNLISIVLVVASYNQSTVSIFDNKVIRNILFSLLLILFYSYFKTCNRHAIIINRYDSYDTEKKRPMDRIVIAYIVGTILLLIGAIIYGRAHYAS